MTNPMKYKQTTRDVIGFGGLAIGTSVAASAVQQVGGNAQGLQNVSAYYPAMGSIYGAGLVLGEVKKLKRKF